MRQLQPVIVTTFGVVTMVASATATLASVHHWQFTPFLFFLQYILLAGLAAHWQRTDQRSRGEAAVMDQALWYGLSWNIALPYYFFRSRGLKRGLLLTLGLLVLLALAYVPAIVIASLPSR